MIRFREPPCAETVQISPLHEMASDCPSGDTAGAEASWTDSDACAGKGIEAIMNKKLMQPTRLTNENMVLILSGLCRTLICMVWRGQEPYFKRSFSNSLII